MSNSEKNNEIELSNNKAMILQNEILTEVEALSLSCWHALADEHIHAQDAAIAFKGIARLARIGIDS